MTSHHTMPPRSDHDVVVRLRELADASKEWQPSADIEARLMRAFAEGQLSGSAPVRVRWVPAIAASAVLATAVALLVFQARGPLPLRTIPSAQPPPSAAADDLEGFVAIPGVGALPRLESGSIVRYELPAAVLPRYGVYVAPPAARSSVEADLLIGQDGYARAIRLVTDR